MAVTTPDPELVADLDAFAGREAALGAWAGAAWALLEASRLSPDRANREQLLLRAVDAMIGAGDLIQAEAFARDAVAFAPGVLRNATLGYLTVLRGKPDEAERLLRSAWKRIDGGDAAVRAAVAQRLALHAVGRLHGREVVEWVQLAVELSSPDDPVRLEAQALLGLGFSWQGRWSEGFAAYDAALADRPDSQTDQLLDRVYMAQGWLRLASDDVVGAHQILAETAPAALQAGSVRIAVWSYVWLARARFALGAWRRGGGGRGEGGGAAGRVRARVVATVGAVRGGRGGCGAGRVGGCGGTRAGCGGAVRGLRADGGGDGLGAGASSGRAG